MKPHLPNPHPADEETVHKGEHRHEGALCDSPLICRTEEHGLPQAEQMRMKRAEGPAGDSSRRRKVRCLAALRVWEPEELPEGRAGQGWAGAEDSWDQLIPKPRSARRLFAYMSQ